MGGCGDEVGVGMTCGNGGCGNDVDGCGNDGWEWVNATGVGAQGCSGGGRLAGAGFLVVGARSVDVWYSGGVGYPMAGMSGLAWGELGVLSR